MASKNSHQTSLKRFTRSTSDRMLAGVCGGLGEYFEIDPSLIRILFVIITFIGGAGVLAYLILWLVTPSSTKIIKPQSQIQQNAQEIAETAQILTQAAKPLNRPNFWAVFLISLGIYFLLKNFNFIPTINWSDYWPIALIILGIYFLAKRK